jgi:HSP20 family molecular chaperone IbpA
MSLFWHHESPIAEMLDMQRRMNSLFNDTHWRTHVSRTGKPRAMGDVRQKPMAWQPVCDVSKTPDSFVVHIELPGIKPSDIHISVEKGILTISGERKVDQRYGEKLYRSERSFGSFSRSFELPKGVDGASVTASYDNGLLEVVVPRPARHDKSITIDIKSAPKEQKLVEQEKVPEANPTDSQTSSAKDNVTEAATPSEASSDDMSRPNVEEKEEKGEEEGSSETKEEEHEETETKTEEVPPLEKTEVEEPVEMKGDESAEETPLEQSKLTPAPALEKSPTADSSPQENANATEVEVQ